VTRSPIDVLLLRHAWAIEREQWSGDDLARPLDGHGRAQARALPAHLETQNLVPVHLVSSPTTRTRATLGPLAERWGLRIHDDDRFLDDDAPFRCADGGAASAWLAMRALTALDALPRQVPRPGAPDAARAIVVICAHGIVIPALMGALGARDGWQLARGPDLTRKAMAKGSGWLLTTGTDEVVVIDPPVVPETTDPGSAS
jgi:8-oxo-(d)GTP phosphatase